MANDKLKILYAEDDYEVAQSVARAITLCSDIENVDIANDGKEMIELFHKNNGDYDMVISDIQMPRLNGIDAIKSIKEKSPNIYTVITTAFNDNEYLLKSIQMNIDKYLLKPLDLRELIDIVDVFYTDKKMKEEYSLQKQMLMIRSKAATMGYMLDAVAHQWKQPLNMICLLNSTIKYHIEAGKLQPEKLKEFTNNIDNAIDHMNDTLTEFRSFLRTDRIKSDFSVKVCLQKVENIIKYDLNQKEIKIFLDLEDDFLINGFANQFTHIILNFINNSKDAFEERDIKQREIKITLKKGEKQNHIIYEDNAGGIPKGVVDKIFDLDFTTKSSDKGSGVGLSLSKQIAANHNGTIKVENISGGSRFVIDIDKTDED